MKSRAKKKAIQMSVKFDGTIVLFDNHFFIKIEYYTHGYYKITRNPQAYSDKKLRT